MEAIKANEIRIGNFFHWNGELAAVTQILELEVVFKCGDVGFIDDLMPIPLTPERLLNCGFRAEGGNNFTLDIDNYFRLNINIANKKDSWINGHKIRRVNYLHTLQNLIFALKRTELPLKF